MPDVTPAEAEHSLLLKRRIAEAMANAGGWLSFEQYMRLALYEPGLGYYSAGAVKFGESGDFITAPEISPFFARACAQFFDRSLRALGGGDLLELGPGSGRFAVDAILAMQELKTPLSRYQMLEVSADLRARQQALLQQMPVQTDWLCTLPIDFSGVIFGNEVIDALPCDRFVIRSGEMWRLGVGQMEAEQADQSIAFEWRARRADGRCAGDEEFLIQTDRLCRSWGSWDLSPAAETLPDGYCGEWQPTLAAWIAALAQSLSAGALVLADYGLPRNQLYHPDRVVGSLRCHQRHHAHTDPFLWPGLVDITSWVDFTAVAEAAMAAGLTVSAFTTQMGFLLASGADATPHNAREAQGLRQLLLPGEMGEAIKFIVLSRDLDLTEYFAQDLLVRQDLRDSLGI